MTVFYSYTIYILLLDFVIVLNMSYWNQTYCPKYGNNKCAIKSDLKIKTSLYVFRYFEIFLIIPIIRDSLLETKLCCRFQYILLTIKIPRNGIEFTCSIVLPFISILNVLPECILCIL